jgi:hypothetical protein
VSELSADFPAVRLGVVSRRTVLKAGAALIVGAGVATMSVPWAAKAVGAAQVRNLTGPALTGQFSAGYTDLAIPALCPDGSLLFICGDTFADQVGGSDWRAPVGLRSSSANRDSLVIDGSVGGAHANGLVPESHAGGTTAIPSDVFTIGSTMYMHLMRGVIYDMDHSDFWKSTDNGETWTYLCQWPADLYGGQFQQKSYAVAADGYCYVVSTAFNRSTTSGLLLFRVPQAQVGLPSAYEPWGFANGTWGWGTPPTTIANARQWGEICFRAMGGKYALTWLNMQSNPIDIRAQVFATPTSNLITTPEQTMVVNGPDGGNSVAALYGGFIFPGSTFSSFDIAVSQWPDHDSQNYHVMQYRVSGLVS